MTKEKRAEIVAFKATHDWSFRLVADAFGLTRNQVAGFIFRHKNPASIRVCSPKSIAPNKLGNGYHGHGAYAKYTAIYYEVRK